MTAIEPYSLAAEWVYQTLKADATVRAQVPALGGEIRVYPSPPPEREKRVAFVSALAGSSVDRPSGGPTMWTLLWDLTAWRQTADMPLLAVPMAAAIAALTGPRYAGKGGRYVSLLTGQAWDVECQYLDLIPDPGDYAGPQPWERITHRFEIRLAPVWT